MGRNTKEVSAEPALAGLRNLTVEDIPGLIKLTEACKEIDEIESIPTVEQMRFQFETPGIEVTNNAFVLEDAHGGIIGTIAAIPLPGAEAFQIQLQCAIHPHYRGGDSKREDLLLEFGLAHAIEWQQSNGCKATLQAGCKSHQQHYIDLYTRHGFAPIRYFHTLERDLHQPIETAPVPEGIIVRSIDWSSDAESLHCALHDSFQDHFNPINFTVEQTKHWATAPDFRPELILLAFGVVDGFETEPAGICLNHVRNNYNKQHNKLEGEVGALGVRRPFRRKGLARALLTQGLTMLRTEGLNTAVLSVDSENPLGATRLYATVGFTQRNTSMIFSRPLG